MGNSIQPEDFRQEVHAFGGHFVFKEIPHLVSPPLGGLRLRLDANCLVRMPAAVIAASASGHTLA